MHVGLQIKSFVSIKPNGSTRHVRFQSAPGLQGDAGGAAIHRRRRPQESRRRRRRDYIKRMARFTIYVMLLGVRVVNSYRQSCAMRSSPSAGAGASDLRGRRRRRGRRDYTMTMARFTIYVVLFRC